MSKENINDDIEITDTDFMPEQDVQQNPKKIEVEVEEDHTPPEPTKISHSENWFGKEGELAIDVYQTQEDIVIQSAIAGVKAEELDIQIEDDVVTIRGSRGNPNENEVKEYFHEECFWGPFSRQIFLPEEIDVKNVEASMKEGIFTLRLPKIHREKTKKVKISKK